MSPRHRMDWPKIVCPPSFVCRQKAVVRVRRFLTEGHQRARNNEEHDDDGVPRAGVDERELRGEGLNVRSAVFPYSNSRFPCWAGRHHPPNLLVQLAASSVSLAETRRSRRSFRRLARVGWREVYMEVLAAFFVILLAGLAFPVLLLISGVLFDLVVATYLLVTTIFRRKRTPGALGVGRRSRRAKKTLGTVVVWEY
jgi:hypothetical protein